MKKKKGFTLIEMIAVIIIIGILALITVPAVSQYINSSKETAYETYEKNMETATSNYLALCMTDNNKDCKIPDKEGESSNIYMNDLIENGLMEELKDPEGEGTCDSSLSYIRIENKGNSNYEYNACLYCGSYQTENYICTTYENDGDNPSCGTVNGETTKWSNQNRTISIGCSDASSGCLKSEFSRTFTETTKTGNITITDKSGNKTECPVNVYVDKTMPTCELEIFGGTLESTGWYSGDVKVKLKSYSDSDSGVLTYGIGTSLQNRDYNKKSSVGVKNGLTTVFGYVKDYAGNEGYCSIDVRVGVPKPQFKVEYGYQIYPNKEAYSLSNLTESGTSLTSTSNDPIMSFTGLNEYKSVNRLVVYFNSGIPQTTIGQVFYSNGTHTEKNSVKTVLAQGALSAEFIIPEGTYNNIRLDLGSLSGVTYNIKKVELRVGNRNELYTNKDVSVNIIPFNEKVATTNYSFDDGATWQTSPTKIYSGNNTSIKIRTKNYATLISEQVIGSIGNIDKTPPTCTLKLDGTKPSGSTWYTTNVTVSFSSTNDTNGSGVRNYGIGSVTGNRTVTHTADNTSGVNYTGYIIDKAGNSATCSTGNFKKKANHTVTFNANGGSTPTASKTVTYASTYGTLPTPTRTGYNFAGWYTAASGGSKITASTTVSIYNNQTLYAHWTAKTFTVTFNANGGNTPTASKTVTYASTYGTLPTPTRTNYNFLGWYTAASGGSKVTASTTVSITSNQTLYAQWKLALVYKCRYRTRSQSCSDNCGSCCGRNKKNNYCISYCDCHGQSCSWGSWGAWSAYNTAYNSYTNTDSRQVECNYVTP